MSNIVIGTAPCSWGVWYKDGTPSGTPYDIFLDQVAAAGYNGLELGPIGYLPTEEAVLREELKKRDLTLYAGTACYEFVSFKSFSDVKPLLDEVCGVISKFNAPYLVTMDGSEFGKHGVLKKDITAQQWNNYIQMFKETGLYTQEKYGIKTVFHPHLDSLIEYDSEIERVMFEANLDLCFDTGHHVYCNGGVEPKDKSALDFIMKYPEKMAYLHFKNMDGAVKKRVNEEKLSGHQAFDLDVMCNLDEGVIDFIELKAVLDKINFKGIGIIEQDMPTATTEQCFKVAKHNINYLKTIGM